MFRFLKKLKIKQGARKRVKIYQRLNKISHLRDPWYKAESLIKFLEKVDTSLLKETVRLAIQIMPETYQQTQVLIQLKVGRDIAEAERIVAKHCNKKRQIEFEKAVLELKNLNLI